MEAVAWTAIGILAATVLGVLFYQGSRIDALGGRIDAMGSRLDARIDTQSARIDELAGRTAENTARLETLSAQMAQHLERHAS